MVLGLNPGYRLYLGKLINLFCFFNLYSGDNSTYLTQGCGLRIEDDRKCFWCMRYKSVVVVLLLFFRKLNEDICYNSLV